MQNFENFAHIFWDKNDKFILFFQVKSYKIPSHFFQAIFWIAKTRSFVVRNAFLTIRGRPRPFQPPGSWRIGLRRLKKKQEQRKLFLKPHSLSLQSSDSNFFRAGFRPGSGKKWHLHLNFKSIFFSLQPISIFVLYDTDVICGLIYDFTYMRLKMGLFLDGPIRLNYTQSSLVFLYENSLYAILFFDPAYILGLCI